MAFRYLNRPRGGSTRAFDTDVLAWEAAVVANGGSVSLARRIILDQFVFSEKDSGAWALTDDYWGLWGENAPQALTSLKQRRLAVAVNSPTFTVDRDYTFDATTNYITLGFIPGTHKVAMADANNRLASYIRNNVTSAMYSFGTSSSSARQLLIRNRSVGSALISASSNGTTFTLPAADSRGLTASSRSGPAAADVLAYKNGASMVRAVDPTTFGALSTFELYAGALNNSGTVVFGGGLGYQVGFGCVGAALSAAQELAQYNAVQAWATSIGAQV